MLWKPQKLFFQEQFLITLIQGVYLITFWNYHLKLEHL